MVRPISVPSRRFRPTSARCTWRTPHRLKSGFISWPGRRRRHRHGCSTPASSSATSPTWPCRRAFSKPNGEAGRQSASLVDALDYFGIRDVHGYTVTEKTEMQDIAIRGAPFTEQEQRDLLDYCEADVEALAPLLERLLTHIRAKRKAPGAPLRGLVQALNRGRYVSAVAHMEHLGIPVDVPTFQWLKEHRLEVREHLIQQSDRGLRRVRRDNI